MFTKIAGFLLSVGINGFFSYFLALITFIFLALLCSFALIPVEIVIGRDFAASIVNLFDGKLCYKIIYMIFFVSLMADDLGIPNIKTLFKRYWKVTTKTA